MRKIRKHHVLIMILIALFLSAGCNGSSNDAPARTMVVDAAFLGDLDFDEDLFFSDENRKVGVRVMVAPSEKSNAVFLYETDGEGRALKYVGDMKDDGKTGTGDRRAQDGIFSYRIDIDSPEMGVGSHYYRAFLDRDGARGSSMVELEIVKRVEASAYTDSTKSLSDLLAATIPNYSGNLTREEFDNHRSLILSAIRSLDDVVEANLTQEGNLIVVKFASGATVIVGDPKSRKMEPSTASEHKHRSASPMAAIGAPTTLCLSPYYNDFYPYDEVEGAYKLVQEVGQALSLDVKPPVMNKDVSPEHFKNISEYGFVLLSSHGTLYNGVPTICISKPLSELYETISADLATGAVMQFYDEDSLLIAPKFISRYNKPNTGDGFINLGICQGLMQEELAEAFLEAGFQGVAGYTESVLVTYCYYCSLTLTENMLAGYSFKESFEKTIAEHGPDDGQGASYAYRLKEGIDDFYLIPRTVQNGDFSEKMRYWDVEGEAMALPTLFGIDPFEGDFMCLLATPDFDDASATYGEISQRFALQPEAKRISFHYDFVSDRPENPAAGAVSDEFRVTITGAEGKETVILSEDIGTAGWEKIELEDPDEPGKTETVMRQGWKYFSFDIPEEMKDDYVTLRFRIVRGDDEDFDSIVLLDSIKLE
ncbi:hypothetical protein LJC31_02855 [Synergistaceae bacterium OttesenSCG-928-I11]|nr:hypothetical protein [Synergistaceae bacterium OttesenSCG-928-I11]